MLIAVLLNYVAARSSSYTGWPFYRDSNIILANAVHLSGLLHLRWIVVAYWTLAIEWQFYIVIVVLYPLLTSSTTYRFWLSLLIINTPVYFNDNESVWFTYASYFSIGFLAFRYLINRINVVTLLLGILLLMVHITCKFSTSQAIAAALPVLVLFIPPIRLYPLSFLSTISYSLYLTHLLTGYNFLKVSQPYATTVDASLLLTFAALIVSIAFAYLTYRLVELPARTLASRL
jgi:peptidoglycan/LPS O-acetylase OafA/YrhL